MGNQGLQWRAEQSLGQTRASTCSCRSSPQRCFNGGPSNRSAKPEGAYVYRRIVVSLQWRAEQSLGQTTKSRIPATLVTLLQWRAEQSLGQTRGVAEDVVYRLRASMEGRAIARPNMQETSVKWKTPLLLQWRAEQSLGQTCHPLLQAQGYHPASMEGRAIARPNQAGQGGHDLAEIASMEGRAIARPNQRPEVGFAGGVDASMEGRAIARPNLQHQGRARDSHLRFNGGPSNRSAKPGTYDAWTAFYGPLQWRAEQSLGQTRPWHSPPQTMSTCFNGGPSNRSAKLRPACRSCGPRRRFNGGPSNRSAKPAGSHQRRHERRGFNGGPSNRSAKPGAADGQLRAAVCFNGGPSNRSAKLHPTGTSTRASAALQWRAEQSLGQTSPALRACRWCRIGFNGGPSNRSAKPPGGRSPHASVSRFNGGPSNRSAKRSGCLSRFPASGLLQWRAEQSLGQTVRIRGVGAPLLVASMEGRAIARPNSRGLSEGRAA